MKATYIYKSAFGDSLLTVTGKSAARGRDSVHNLRWERTRYIDRIAELNKNVQNLRKANAVARNHARKEGERMLADIERLHNEALEARRDYDTALKIANRDKQALLDEVEALTEENHNLCDEITRLQEAYESLNEENKSLCSEIARLNDELAFVTEWKRKLARQLDDALAMVDRVSTERDKVADRLHACRIDRRKWRDIAERCFAAAMKNAVALADEHKLGA